MSTNNTRIPSPAEVPLPHHDAYQAAVRDLLDSIKLNGFMDDDALHALLAGEETAADQKALSVGLYHRGVIAFEQCSAMFYCFDMREA